MERVLVVGRSDLLDRIRKAQQYGSPYPLADPAENADIAHLILSLSHESFSPSSARIVSL